MAVYIVEGGRALTGRIDIQGSKNAVLPLMAAAIINKGITILDNCPLINDVYAMADIIKSSGCKVAISESEHRMVIDAGCINTAHIESEKVMNVRASVLLIGAMLSRCGYAVIRYPGGCNIGQRPIDYHLDSFKKMGIHVVTDNNSITCSKKAAAAAIINLPFPSVGATENIMLAACSAANDIHIHNAAKEPEIVELASLLTKYGMVVCGAGTSDIYIKGSVTMPELYVQHTVISDRIVAGTYAYAAAITSGEVTCRVNNMSVADCMIDVLHNTGCIITKGNDYIRIKAAKTIQPVAYIETAPYPGFPTDMQSQLMALMSIADGTSLIREKIFENRFHVADELIKMGADISIYADKAVIRGKTKLRGATVYSKDLRGGAALILAGLGAEGVTYINDPGYVGRGYENITGDLIRLGGNIQYE